MHIHSNFVFTIGLMRDDTIHENDDVKEAIRRLPENLYNDRVFRIKRALDLSMRQQILPKEQWTKYEEDKFYLEPYLKEVIQERREREEWAKKQFSSLNLWVQLFSSIFMKLVKPEMYNVELSGL